MMLLSTVYCLLSAVRCLLSAVCCLLSTVCSDEMRFSVCCLRVRVVQIPRQPEKRTW